MSQDDYLNDLASQKRDETNTTIGAVGRGAYQGVTFDFGDELEARFLSMVKPDSSYQKELDRIHGQIDSYKRTHPKSMLGGEIGGATASMLAPLGWTGRVTKGMNALARGSALTLEGATLSALQAYGQSRDKGNSLDDVLNGALLGAIFVPLGGLAGRLAGNIISPFGKWLDKNMGGQEARAVINALKSYARAGGMSLNDALKGIIINRVPLMDISPTFANLGKKIATDWERTGGKIIRDGADANLDMQSTSIKNESFKNLIPSGNVLPDQIDGFNNFLDVFEESLEKQAKKTEDAYTSALSPSSQGISAVPSNELIQAFNNMIEVNPQFLKRANQLLRTKLNLSYNPLKINKKTGKLENLTNKKLTMDVIESVAQEVKDLSYKMKSSQAGRNIREKQQEPVTTLINKEIPSIVDARSSNTAKQLALKVEKEARNMFSGSGAKTDEFLKNYDKNLAKITNKVDKDFLKEQYRIALAREIRDSMTSVKGLNSLIDNFNKSDSSVSRIFQKLYPNKSIETLIGKFENAKSALTSKRIVTKRSDTASNLIEHKRADMADDGLSLTQSISQGGLSAGAFNLSRKLLNFLKQEGYSEADAIRLAEILTSRNVGNAKELYSRLISRPELIENLFSGGFDRIGKAGVLETVTDEPQSKLGQTTRGTIDNLIRMMR